MGETLFGDVSTRDDGARNAFDYYPTPGWMTRSLLYSHPAIKGASVLEPCAGADAITSVLRAAGCPVTGNDLDIRHGHRFYMDATSQEFWLRMAVDPCEWVITNPPFNVALPILQHAVEHARIGVAFLLRKTFLEPTDERGPWLQAHPPTRIIGQPRYSFRGTGSDSVSCDWCVWERRPDRSLPPVVIDYVAERRTR
jgi:hypothetical protein